MGLFGNGLSNEEKTAIENMRKEKEKIKKEEQKKQQEEIEEIDDIEIETEETDSSKLEEDMVQSIENYAMHNGIINTIGMLETIKLQLNQTTNTENLETTEVTKDDTEQSEDEFLETE